METEAESVISEKARADAEEQEKLQDNEKGSTTLNNEPESAESLLEVERKSTDRTRLGDFYA